MWAELVRLKASASRPRGAANKFLSFQNVQVILDRHFRPHGGIWVPAPSKLAPILLFVGVESIWQHRTGLHIEEVKKNWGYGLIRLEILEAEKIELAILKLVIVLTKTYLLQYRERLSRPFATSVWLLIALTPLRSSHSYHLPSGPGVRLALFFLAGQREE